MALANQPQSSCGKADSFQGTIDFISSQSIFSPHNLKVVNGSYGEEIHAATSQPKLLTITMDEDYQDDSCKDLTAAKTRAITYAESHCKSQEHLPKSGRLQLLAGLKNTDISVVNESRTSHYKGRPTYTWQFFMKTVRKWKMQRRTTRIIESWKNGTYRSRIFYGKRVFQITATLCPWSLRWNKNIFHYQSSFGQL